MDWPHNLSETWEWSCNEPAAVYDYTAVAQSESGAPVTTTGTFRAGRTAAWCRAAKGREPHHTHRPTPSQPQPAPAPKPAPHPPRQISVAEIYAQSNEEELRRFGTRGTIDGSGNFYNATDCHTTGYATGQCTITDSGPDIPFCQYIDYVTESDSGSLSVRSSEPNECQRVFEENDVP
jgi:hypothetical protein